MSEFATDIVSHIVVVTASRFHTPITKVMALVTYLLYCYLVTLHLSIAQATYVAVCFDQLYANLHVHTLS